MSVRGTRYARGLVALCLLTSGVVDWASAQDNILPTDPGATRRMQRQRWQRGGSYEHAFDGRNGVPRWEKDQLFEHDVFTFVRIHYTSHSGWDRWATDYPDSDLNLSYRLQQLTSLKVDPDGRVLSINDPELFQYPFIYMIEPGNLMFEDDELPALRRYLLNGGFLLVDDFWGEAEWANFEQQIARVFPDRKPEDVPLEHPIFHFVYDLKEKPQIPSIDIAINGRSTGRTWEREDAREPHFRAIYDDKGRMMVFISHNCDLGDGWEREGDDPWYFREFSEKKAYPLGINIVFYALTH